MHAPDTLKKVWPILGEDAHYGFAGDVVRTLDPHTEADPVAVLFQLLVCFGNIAGRNAYFQLEDDKHYSNEFLALVGGTGQRKLTGLNRIKAIIERALLPSDQFVFEPDWVRNHIRGGLASGEGLVKAVCDDKYKLNKNGEQELVEEGVTDKRLVVMEPEFALLLEVMSRSGSTISERIRQAYDTGDLGVMRVNAERATGAHISMIGHITEAELREKLTQTSMANGFANRFLIALSKRSKALPDGGALTENEANKLAKALWQAITWTQKIGNIRVTRTDAARDLWRSIYGALSTHQQTLLGAITGRSEAHVVRLSLIYALLDCSTQIDEPHLRAALAAWQYCADSAKYIFGDALGNVVADTTLRALRNNGQTGLSRNDILNLFGRNYAKDRIDSGLGMLLEQGLARCEQRGGTGGRPADIWFAV
jgi:hypothetical protein